MIIKFDKTAVEGISTFLREFTGSVVFSTSFSERAENFRASHRGGKAHCLPSQCVESVSYT